MPYIALAYSYWVSFHDAYQCQGHAHKRYCNILFIRALEHALPRQNTAILMISKDAQSRTCTHNYRKVLYRITRMHTTKSSNECSVRVTTSSPILSWVFITITLRGTPLAVRSAWFNNASFVNRN